MGSSPFSFTNLATGAALCALAVPGLALARGGDSVADADHALPTDIAVLGPYTAGPIPRGDSLYHFIVRPDGSPLTETPAVSESSVTGPGVTGTAPDGSFWQLDADLLESLPPGAELTLDDGELRVKLPDGTLVDLDSGLSASEGSAVDEGTMPATSLGHPTIDKMVQLPGVEEVLPIGDGSYAVAVSDPAVLDALPLIVDDDVLLTLFADPYERYQWALDNTGTNLHGLNINPMPVHVVDADIDGTEARATATGEGVVVAVIDSGVDFSHPDLAGARWQNPGETCGNGIDDDSNGYVDDCEGWDFGYEDSTPFNPGAHPHGTHVAGIIAATAGNGIGVAGVAPDAKIMNLNVGVTTPSGPSISTSSVARAIRYAADNGADVINLSLGTPPGTPRSAMAATESAIAYAGEHGVVVAIAAGNDNVNLATSQVWPASFEGDHILTVVASTPSETKASFSNYGGAADVVAPGHYILSTVPAANGSYTFMSGTSQAAPIVAGVAALVISARPSSSAAQVTAAITGSVDRASAYTAYVGGGVRANAANAVGLSEPVVGLDEITVAVSGLAQASTDAPIDAEFDIAVPTDTFEENYGWEATLYTMQGARPMPWSATSSTSTGRQWRPMGAAQCRSTRPVPLGSHFPRSFRPGSMPWSWRPCRATIRGADSVSPSWRRSPLPTPMEEAREHPRRQPLWRRPRPHCRLRPPRRR